MDIVKKQDMYCLDFFDSSLYYNNIIYRWIKNYEVRDRNFLIHIFVHKKIYTYALKNVNILYLYYKTALNNLDELVAINKLKNLHTLNLFNHHDQTEVIKINKSININTLDLNYFEVNNFDALGAVSELMLNKCNTNYLPHGIKILTIGLDSKIANLPSSIKILKIMKTRKTLESNESSQNYYRSILTDKKIFKRVSLKLSPNFYKLL